MAPGVISAAFVIFSNERFLSDYSAVYDRVENVGVRAAP